MMYIIPSTDRHTRWIGRFMRSADLLEIEHLPLIPTQVLQQGRELCGQSCWTIMLDRVPVGMFGVTPEGCVWLLGTDLLVAHQAEFLRGALAEFDNFFWPHDELWNRMDIRNVVHQRWLTWLGFQFHETISGKVSFTHVRSDLNRRPGHRGRIRRHGHQGPG